MATPQATVRVEPERRTAWQDCATSHGYTMSELIRALMDGAVTGEVNIPPPPKDGKCRFGGHDGCTQPRKHYPWATICETCDFRPEG